MKFNRFSTLYLLGAVALAGGCQQQDIEGIDNGSEVNLSVEVSKPYLDSSTRTALTENNKGNLDCVWTANDNLVVTDLSGVQKGILTLMNGYANKDHGLFDGTVSGVGDGEQTLNFYYLGVNNLGHVAGTNRTLDFSSQRGSEASLGDNDLLSASCKVNVDGKSAYAENISLLREVAFGRFQLNLPEGVDAVGKTVTVKGENVYSSATLTYANGGLTSVEGNISVTVQPGNEFFLTLIPGQDGAAITLNFEVTVDDITYTGTPGQRVWKKGEYVRQDLGNGSYAGIPVEMTKVGGEEPEPVFDDTVGPTITIDGKKYRFLKGNLYYNTKSKEWKIFEKETYYLNAAGVSTDYSTSGTPEEIDLFPWGATGLSNAKRPDYIRHGWAGEYTLAGSNWPSSNTGTMDLAGNANIIDLWKSYGDETNPVYDYGYAYMLNGRPDGDNRTYRTAPLEAYAYICNQEYSFSQGCTIKGAGLNGEDVKGALIIPGITTVEEAKAKITEVGGTPGNLVKLDVTVNNAGFDFYITLPDYESISKLNAMFFALAGSSNWATKQQLSTNCGAYWTKDAAKGSSTDANAYCFFFRKSSSASEFHWVVGRNGVSVTRRTQNSVRLMVEVTE